MSEFRRRLLSMLGFNWDPDKLTVDNVGNVRSNDGITSIFFAVKYNGRLLEADEFDVSVSSSEISNGGGYQNRSCRYYKGHNTYGSIEYNVKKYYNWNLYSVFYIYYQGHICLVNSSTAEIIRWL